LVVHILRITAMFFAGLLAALAIAVFEMDVDAMKPRIVQALEETTGMPIEIGGALSWKLSLRPQISIKDVRVKNASWAKRAYAVQVPEIVVDINIVSLFRDRPTVQSVKMIRPVVNIEKRADGELSAAPKKRFMIPMRMKDREYPFDFDIVVGSVELDRPKVSFIDSNGEEDTFSLERIKVVPKSEGDARIYSGALTGADGDYGFALTFEKYDSVKKIYPVKLAVGGDIVRLAATIALDGGTKAPTDLVLSGSILNWRALAGGLGLGPLAISHADVAVSAGMDKKTITVRSFSLKTRQSDMEVSGKINLARARPQITLGVKSRVIILADIFPNMYKGGRPRPNRPLNAFKDTPLFPELLAALDMDLTVDVGKFISYREMAILDMAVKLRTDDGRGIFESSVGYMGGYVATRASIRSDDGVLRARLAARGRGVSVGELMESLRLDRYIMGLPADMDVYAVSRGRDLSELMANLTGLVLVETAAGGYAQEDLIEVLYGRDFLTSVRDSLENILDGRRKRNLMRISCAAANLKLRNGRVELDKNAAVQTRAVNILFVGNMDLGRETMMLALDATPVEGLKLSLTGALINNMEIVGNLSEPDIKWNRDAVAGKVATAAGIGLAVGALTGGAGLLVGATAGFLGVDVIGAWTADEVPCRTALKAPPPAKSGDPDFMNRPVKHLVDEFM